MALSAEPVAARHLYAFLTIAGLEELAIRALSAEDQLQDATALPVPEGTIGGAAAGVGAILVRTAMPLPPRVFESPVVCCSLAVVMQCELGEGEGLTNDEKHCRNTQYRNFGLDRKYIFFSSVWAENLGASVSRPGDLQILVRSAYLSLFFIGFSLPSTLKLTLILTLILTLTQIIFATP